MIEFEGSPVDSAAVSFDLGSVNSFRFLRRADTVTGGARVIGDAVRQNTERIQP
jgi:hypothetical protein